MHNLPVKDSKDIILYILQFVKKYVSSPSKKQTQKEKNPLDEQVKI